VKGKLYTPPALALGKEFTVLAGLETRVGPGTNLKALKKRQLYFSRRELYPETIFKMQFFLILWRFITFFRHRVDRSSADGIQAGRCRGRIPVQARFRTSV